MEIYIYLEKQLGANERSIQSKYILQKKGEKIRTYMTHALLKLKLTTFCVYLASKVTMCMISRMRQTV